MKNITELNQMKRSTERQDLTEQLQFIPGIWVNGKYFWLQNCLEKVLYDEELVIRVKQEQTHSKIRSANVYVSNHGTSVKEIKLLAMHHYTHISHDNLTFVSPTDNRVFHLANKRVFLVNVNHDGFGTKEYTAIPQWYAYTDQIWASLPKGTLKYQPMAKGPAASIFAIKMSLQPRETNKVNTWTISGTNKNELLLMEQALLKQYR